MFEEYVEKGGAWLFPGSSATWPFVTLRVSQERIQIQLMYRKYDFKRSEIKSLEKRSSLLSKGIVIKTTKILEPQFIVFWTFNYRKLKNALAQMGYEVIEK